MQLFLVSFLLVLVTLDLLVLQILLHNLLLVLKFLDLIAVHQLIDFQGLMVTICELCDQDSVVGLTAILEEDLVNFPDGSDDRIVAPSRLEDLFQEFEKSDRIDEQGTINPVYILGRDACLS